MIFCLHFWQNNSDVFKPQHLQNKCKLLQHFFPKIFQMILYIAHCWLQLQYHITCNIVCAIGVGTLKALGAHDPNILVTMEEKIWALLKLLASNFVVVPPHTKIYYYTMLRAILGDNLREFGCYWILVVVTSANPIRCSESQLPCGFLSE